MEDFGDRLRKQRDSLGLNQRDFAARMRVGKTQIHRWETGDGKEFLSRVAALAHELNVRPGWLAFGDGDPPAVAAFSRKFIADLRARLDTAGAELTALMPPAEQAPATKPGQQGEPETDTTPEPVRSLADVKLLKPAAPPPLYSPEEHPRIDESTLHDMTPGKIGQFIKVAAGHPMYDISEECQFMENGAKFIVATVNGTSMAGRGKLGIPDNARVLLEMLPVPVEVKPNGKELIDFRDIASGDIYLVDVEDGDVRGLTLKRVSIFPHGVNLSADNPPGWGGRTMLTISLGDSATILAKFKGIIKPKRKGK